MSDLDPVNQIPGEGGLEEILKGGDYESLRWILRSTGVPFGDRMPSWAGTENLEMVAKRAKRKIPSNRAGSIPPRVTNEVLGEAVWAETEILQEYLAGVLAAAHSTLSKSDRGVAWASMIGRLSSDQVALHWALYSSTQKHCRSKSWDSIWDVTSTQFVADSVDLLQCLGWLSPSQKAEIRLLEAAYGLEREGLLTKLSHGDGRYLAEKVSYTADRRYEPDKMYLTFAPTSHGVGLLLQALGLEEPWLDDFVYSNEVEQIIDSTEELPQFEATRFVADYPLVDGE